MFDQDVFLERALVDEGLLTSEQVEAVRRYGSEHEVDLVDALIRTDTLGSRQIALVRADVCEAPFVDVGSYEVCFANTQLLPRSIAERT